MGTVNLMRKGGYVLGKNPVKWQCKPEEIVMIDAYLSGATKTDAFRRAFPERAEKAKALGRMAQNAFESDHVIAELERRRAAREKALQKSAESEAERVAKLWSREQHLKALLELKDWSAGVRETADSNKDAVAAGKLERETMDSIGKMLGFDAPVKVESDTSITVRFGSGDWNDDWAK